MNISAINAAYPSRVNASFKAAEKKPFIEVTDDMPDDAVVGYSNWGDNYAYPITAGQIRAAQRQQEAMEELRRQAAADNARNQKKESEEEYKARKIYSTEWCM